MPPQPRMITGRGGSSRQPGHRFVMDREAGPQPCDSTPLPFRAVLVHRFRVLDWQYGGRGRAEGSVTDDNKRTTLNLSIDHPASAILKFKRAKSGTKCRPGGNICDRCCMHFDCNCGASGYGLAENWAPNSPDERGAGFAIGRCPRGGAIQFFIVFWMCQTRHSRGAKRAAVCCSQREPLQQAPRF